MKKTLMFVVLCFCFLLAGCGPKTRIVAETDPEATTWVEIDAATLAAKIAAGDDFILVVSSETCSSCTEFRPFLDAMIVTYGVVVYMIESGVDFPATNLVFVYDYTPTVAIFAGGEVVVSIDPSGQDRPFESTEHFIDWIDAYVELPMR